MGEHVAEVDPTLCVGSQVCVSLAPEAFDFVLDSGVSRFVGPAEDADAVLEAAEACPVLAITVRDAETGELVFPVAPDVSR